MPAPTIKQNGMQIPEALAGEFADFVMWDAAKNAPAAVSRDAMGEQFAKIAGIDPALEGRFEVTLANGKKVEARTVFDLTKEYLDANVTPEQGSKVTWAPADAIRVACAHCRRERRAHADRLRHGAEPVLEQRQ